MSPEKVSNVLSSIVLISLFDTFLKQKKKRNFTMETKCYWSQNTTVWVCSRFRHKVYLVYCLISKSMIMEWTYCVCGERNAEKHINRSLKIGLTFRTLDWWSNHWATENSSGEQWSIVGCGTTTASRIILLCPIPRARAVTFWVERGGGGGGGGGGA